MARRYEIRLAGSGGQGLVLAGVILAEAAGIYDGKFVCQTQSYGPAARGGASKAEVVISDAEIDYPKAIRPDVLLAMNQTSLDKYLADLKPGGVLLVDADLVREVPRGFFIRGGGHSFHPPGPRGGPGDDGQHCGPGGPGCRHPGSLGGRLEERGPGPGAAPDPGAE